jgi:hypothetical protein
MEKCSGLGEEKNYCIGTQTLANSIMHEDVRI